MITETEALALDKRLKTLFKEIKSSEFIEEGEFLSLQREISELKRRLLSDIKRAKIRESHMTSVK